MDISRGEEEESTSEIIIKAPNEKLLKHLSNKFSQESHVEKNISYIPQNISHIGHNLSEVTI